MHRVFLFHERGVKGSSRCSVAAMATFCLLSACKDAPPYSSYSNPILYEKGFGYVFCLSEILRKDYTER